MMNSYSAGSKFLAATLTLLAGSTTFTTGQIDSELRPHVEAVREVMAREGVTLDKSIDFVIADRLHKDNVVGIARTRGRFHRVITVKSSALRNYTDAGMVVLLLHEIGHAQFDLGHDEGPKRPCDAPIDAMRIMHTRICYGLISDLDSVSKQVNEILRVMRDKQNL